MSNDEPNTPITLSGRKLEQALHDWLSASRRAYTSADAGADDAERAAWSEVAGLIAAGRPEDPSRTPA